MSVELPLKTKYTKVTNGKVRTRSGGGNSTKKHPNKHQGAKKHDQDQTEANRRVLVIFNGKKHWVLLSLYRELNSLEGYLNGRSS